MQQTDYVKSFAWQNFLHTKRKTTSAQLPAGQYLLNVCSGPLTYSLKFFSSTRGPKIVIFFSKHEFLPLLFAFQKQNLEITSNCISSSGSHGCLLLIFFLSPTLTLTTWVFLPPSRWPSLGNGNPSVPQHWSVTFRMLGFFSTDGCCVHFS